MKFSERQLAHLGLRGLLGVNIALHGATRVGDPGGFATSLAAQFTETPLPAALVYGFAWLLPFLELALGLAILAGTYLREALFAGLLLMIVLSTGTCLRQQWEAAAIQLLYGGVYWGLLAHCSDARWVLRRHA